MIVGSLGAPHDPGLDELLGADGARELRTALARPRAALGRRGGAAARLRGDHPRRGGGRRGPATTAPSCSPPPTSPRLTPRWRARRLEDLAAGCDIALGAAHDARPYLLAVPRPDPALLALVERSLDGGVLGAFAERGVTLGMLRHERRLASAADARALAIDPLAPPDLAALVRGRLREPPHR